MANLFGAIDVGSHEMELKIFELSKKNGIRQVDDIIHLIDLGTDTYNDGKISFAHVAEVKRILLDFKRIMDGYGVRDYQAYGTSAFRDMDNATLVLRQIEQDKDIQRTKEEQALLTFGVLACLKGLKEQGCDGPVEDAIVKIEKHINQAAHE